MNKTIVALILFVSTVPAPSFAAKDYMEKVPPGQEKDYEPGNRVVTSYQIDIDGDKKPELVKVMYGHGVSNKPLSIYIFKDGKLISTLKDEFGIQSNYKIADIDGDGRKEIIIWSGLWDSRLPGEDGVTEATYEGHSGFHRYIVATYKLLPVEGGRKYFLWDIYTTKKKYAPWCEEQPI